MATCPPPAHSFKPRSRRRAARVLACLSGLSLVLGSAGPVSAQLSSVVETNTATQKETGFEDGNITPFWTCTTQSPNYGRAATYNGARAMQFYWTQVGYDGTRMDRGAEACSDLKVYKEGWYGFKFLLPSSGYPRDKSAVIAQIFGNGGCSSWAGTLQVKSNELWVDHRGACASATSTRLDTNIARDAWRSVIIHYVVSKANAGRVEVWYNGAGKSTPTYRATNINFASWGTYDGDSLAKIAGNHIGLKFGMYCYDDGHYTTGENRTMYYDNVSQLDGNPSNAFDLVNPNG